MNNPIVRGKLDDKQSVIRCVHCSQPIETQDDLAVGSGVGSVKAFHLDCFAEQMRDTPWLGRRSYRILNGPNANRSLKIATLLTKLAVIGWIGWLVLVELANLLFKVSYEMRLLTWGLTPIVAIYIGLGVWHISLLRQAQELTRRLPK